MSRIRPVRAFTVAAAIALVVGSAAGLRAPATAAEATARLSADSRGPVALTANPQTGTPSFIRARIPMAEAKGVAADAAKLAGAVDDRYGAALGIDKATDTLRPVAASSDAKGFRHLRYVQVHQGVEVFDAELGVHVKPATGEIVAIGDGVVPRLGKVATTPTVSAAQATATAKRSLPRGSVERTARLVLFPTTRAGWAPSATLAWVVQLRDLRAPARNLYVVDARSGRVVRTVHLLETARDRRTYSANGSETLPGTLKRSEGDPPTGDADVDNAHDGVGATYDYYANTHGRDSYDGAGATLIATAHYGVGFQNAFWDGAQMVYGDGFPVKDVTAHELTHAVTERTANLEYLWQSGALNESFSDIFGAMVDRDDWTMGEDLPIGAIRDLENPGRFGDPANASEWVVTCDDNAGVHTNSTINSKAAVNLATATSREVAEKVFYRTLTTYLQPTSTFEDARAAAIQAATDLFGAGSAEVTATTDAYNAVGVDGNWQPPPANC